MKKIYIAVSKETGEVMSGARGQHAYGSVASLTKSVGQDYWTRKKANEKGIRPRDLYDIYTIDASVVIEKGEKIQ